MNPEQRFRQQFATFPIGLEAVSDRPGHYRLLNSLPILSHQLQSLGFAVVGLETAHKGESALRYVYDLQRGTTLEKAYRDAQEHFLDLASVILENADGLRMTILAEESSYILRADTAELATFLATVATREVPNDHRP